MKRMRSCKALALAKNALFNGTATASELEFGAFFGSRCLSTSTDLKAVLTEKIPAEQVQSNALTKI